MSATAAGAGMRERLIVAGGVMFKTVERGV
jgi:hypothetical protein